MKPKPTTATTPVPQLPTAWCPGQSVSWAYGPLRRLVSATVLRDEGQPWVHLRIRRADGACVHRKVPRDRVVGVGQGDLFGVTQSPPGTPAGVGLTQSPPGTQAGVAEDRRPHAALPWSGRTGRTS